MSTPRTAEQHAAELEALDRVRRRVLAIGFFAVVIHAVLALVYVAIKRQDDAQTGDAVILLVLSGVVGLIMVAAMRLILRHNPLAPLWLVIALIPTAVGVYLTFA